MRKLRYLLMAAFVSLSWNCNAQNEGAIEKVDLSKFEHGMMGVDVPGGPYYIIRRTPEETNLLIDKYGQGNLRSGNKRLWRQDLEN